MDQFLSIYYICCNTVSMFWFFGHEACGILTSQPGIEPTPPALEGKVLTTGQSEKFQDN